MNEKIDLRQILRGCPKGTELYSPLFGTVYFYKIEHNYGYPIIVTYEKENIKTCISFTSDGRYLSEYDNGECLLFPSKDQRDWSKFKAPWLNKPKFDPKTLKSQYRPFKTQEECWNEMLKHQPFGYLRNIGSKNIIAQITGMSTVAYGEVHIDLSVNLHSFYTADCLFELYTFTDGKPFGIKEE